MILDQLTKDCNKFDISFVDVSKVGHRIQQNFTFENHSKINPLKERGDTLVKSLKGYPKVILGPIDSFANSEVMFQYYYPTSYPLMTLF